MNRKGSAQQGWCPEKPMVQMDTEVRKRPFSQAPWLGLNHPLLGYPRVIHTCCKAKGTQVIKVFVAGCTGYKIPPKKWKLADPKSKGSHLQERGLSSFSSYFILPRSYWLTLTEKSSSRKGLIEVWPAGHHFSTAWLSISCCKNKGASCLSAVNRALHFNSRRETPMLISVLTMIVESQQITSSF